MTKFLSLCCLVILLVYLPVTAQTDTTFASSQSCSGCHAGLYTEWQKTGHAYMLVRSQDANPPEYPELEIDMNVGGQTFTVTPGVPEPPPGLDWEDIGWVSGGFFWKSRFIDNEGYLITGPNRQYNNAPGQWAAWGDEGKRPYDYDCFVCHTTGPSPTSIIEADEAKITVTVSDLGLEFGSIDNWEASLYAGAIIGEETGGRFTDWIAADNGAVVFSLPHQIREGSEAPWGIPNDTYVRIRHVGENAYPTFDMVGDPFTLDYQEYMVHFEINGENFATEKASISVTLSDLGLEFGAIDNWEASIYAGAEIGEETGGRFTDWKEAENGVVKFHLPDEIREGREAPWGVPNDTYVRIRHVGDGVYPTFDMVGDPFTLEYQNYIVHFDIEGVNEDVDENASISVTLTDLGLEFGAIENWEASLYAGAEIGEETGGRFTDWKEAVNGVVRFDLPNEVREGREAPWNVTDDTYVRIRHVGDDVYPTFDMVSDAFTLEYNNYAVEFVLEGENESTENDNGTMVVAHLQDKGGEFGTPGDWEASLYAGAVAGEETGGRFTDWVAVDNNTVAFNLPDDVRDGSEAPWDEDAYIRVRPVDRAEGYPQYDFVGLPFTLTEGQKIDSYLHLTRSAAMSEDAIITVHLVDHGGEFGRPGDWEASLYAGAVAGEETGGRFTDWVALNNSAVVFALPEDVRDGSEAPWDEDAYIRVRPVDRAEGYPQYDFVGLPFVLVKGQNINSSLHLYRSADTGEDAMITVQLVDHGGEFGTPGVWETSLYAGAVAGEETGGRFTDWVAVDNDAVVFNLPGDVRDGSEAPWDEDAYIRVRPVDRAEGYPQFDFVGLPFMLTRGQNISSNLHFIRSAEVYTEHPGFAGGSWAEAGITCEACHGPSSFHVPAAGGAVANRPPKIDGFQTCYYCHARDQNEMSEWRARTVNDVPTGFIRHREQADMMLASTHMTNAGMDCATCHDPHKSVVFDQGGISTTCEDCHAGKEINILDGAGDVVAAKSASCVDCHMPYASRSATQFSPYESDVRGHFWRILTEPITMFENLDTTYREDGSIAGLWIHIDEDGHSGLTLDYSCMNCHIDKDVEWAAQYAVNIHDGITNVELIAGETPHTYSLSQNYPNPFNPTTTINFSVREQGHATLTIYNSIGQRVETLVNEVVNPGQYSVMWDASNVSSGAYFYRLEVNGYALMKRMILIK